MAFPTTLSTAPLAKSFSEEASINPTIKSPKESGYVQTRAVFTRIPGKFHVAYSGLTNADRALLKAHQAEVRVSAALFSWTNPQDAVTCDVRYANPIKFALEDTFDSNGYNTWSAEFDLDGV